MRILVTGASGYIGQHLCKMLAFNKKDIEVHRLDIEEENGKLSRHADIRVASSVARAAAEIHYDAVIHLAALVRVGESVEKPWEYYDTNIMGTLNCLRHISYDNFIFASTGAAEKPDSPYGRSKRVAEDIVFDYCKANNKKTTVFRFYNVIGTDGYEATNPDGLFYNLVKAIQTGSFNLYGTDYNTADGSCVREYVHVNDICRALIIAINNHTNDVQNLAYGDTRTVREIIEIFKKVNGVDFKVVEKLGRPGDLEACYLTNPSVYMTRNYTYEEMLKI
jgi:UDP-glucose 4-epimerase